MKSVQFLENARNIPEVLELLPVSQNVSRTTRVRG